MMLSKNFFIILFLVVFLSACQTPGGNLSITWPPDNQKSQHVSKSPGHGPPAHAKAHGHRRKFGYKYYPDAQVYFDASRKAYFYLDGGAWRMSVSVPSELKIRLGDSVEIEMDCDKPYTEFKGHKAKVPGNRNKKNKNNKKKKNGNKWWD
jgi:hypothetical protein